MERHLHDEAHDIEYQPDEAVVQLSEAARTVIPADSRYSFLGESGNPLWVIPQAESAFIVFLGMAADGVDQGVMSGDKVRFTLDSFSGPGQFILYSILGFGQPIVHMNTGDGVTETSDFIELVAGGHQHMNWAFTAPGRYEIRLKASGVLAANNAVTTSPVAVYTFSVPEGAAPAPAPHFTFETFDMPGATETLLSDIRNDGTLVGRFKDANGISQGFIQQGTNLTVFNVTGTTATFPGGIDSQGRVAGFFRDKTNPDVQRGFLRETNGTFVTFDSPGNTTFTYAWRINDAGQINGYHFENEPFFIRSFRREPDGSFTTNIVFQDSPTGTVTRGMNEAGTLAGWKWDENFKLQGIVYSGGNFTEVFRVTNWDNTLPGDINNRSEIAGTVNVAFQKFAGFFRRADGSTSVFSPPGAASVEVFGLNDEGVIVGEYVDLSGQHHGFIAHPVPGIDRGDTDIGVAFENDEFDLHIHHEVTDTEYAPDQASLVVGTVAEQLIPDTVAFSFLGRPGYSTWILPAVENENLLFLGLAAEEIDQGIFMDDRIVVSLASVTGPGDVALYTTDALGNPVVHWNTADGITASDHFNLIAGSHNHADWTFSAPGTYRIGLLASGTLVAGNLAVTSEIAYYTVEVPEPKLPQPPEPDNGVYLVTDLGTLGGPTSRALHINEEGHVVGDAVNALGQTRAFLWTNGVMTDLGTLGGTNATALGLNDRGQVVGRAQNDSFRMRAFVWDPSQGMIEAPGLGGTGGSFDSSLYVIDNSGLAVGFARNADGQLQAFYWTNGISTALPLPGGNNNRVWDVNETGQMAGWGRDSNNAIVGYRWSVAQGYELVGNLVPGADVFAVGINTNGHITGAIQKDFGHQPASATPPVSLAFVWDGKSLRDIGRPEGFDGAAGNYINDLGWVAGVAYRFNASGQPAEDSAFLHKDGVNHELNRVLPFGSGWHLQWAYDINNRGEIAGWGLKDGQMRGYLATPATRVSLGDTDVGVAFEDGEFNLHVHHEATDTEYAPDEALLHVAALAQTPVPPAASFRFLGGAGEPVWILPQAENPKLLFLGLGAEEITNGVFVADQVKLSLKSVDGPGQAALYTIDGFGNPQVRWNSADGLTDEDHFTLQAGSHEHANWAFTAPGSYRIGLQASGTLVTGNEAVTSEIAYYHVEVISPAVELTLVRQDAGSLSLVLTTQDGVIYRLQSTSTITGPWNNVGQSFIGTGRDKQFTVPIGAGAAFYRVVRGN
ncbi:MAG: choice-of-anchor M domain-containing protein [Verrucomicrobiales bacterium]|nr:choice-of-anchor M domain-containing protein [Verrucomicrobiales bacterium]